MISFLNNIFKICFDHEWSWNTIRLCLQFSIMKSKTSTDLITILMYIIHKFYNFSLVIRRAQVPSWSIVMHPLRRIIGFWASYIRDHTMRVLLFVFSSPPGPERECFAFLSQVIAVVNECVSNNIKHNNQYFANKTNLCLLFCQMQKWMFGDFQ